MYDKEVLAKGTGASFAVVALIGLIVASTGAAYGLNLAGAGTFTVTADHIEADDVVIYPGKDDGNPAATIELQDAHIEGMVIEKDVPIPGTGQQAAFEITSSAPVKAPGQFMKANLIDVPDCGNAFFNGQTIDSANGQGTDNKFLIGIGEQGDYPSNTKTDVPIGPKGDRPAQVLTTNGQGANCGGDEKVTIEAQYLATSQINIPGLSFAIDIESQNGGGGE